MALMQVVVMTNVFKRLFYRKRPGMNQPNRAVVYDRSERNSSIVSQSVVVAAVLGYAQGYGMEESFVSGVVGGTVGYLIISVLKVHTGSIFPSDLIFTFPVCVLNITGYHFWFTFLINPPSQKQALISTSSILLLTIISQLHPIQLFKKTPLWMSTSFSHLIFYSQFQINEHQR